MKKTLLIIGCIFILVIAGVVFYLSKNLNQIVKSAIENVGTRIAGTRVSVGQVDISPSKGRITIQNLRMANPKGFSRGSMVNCEEITAEVDLKSGVIRQAHIGNPHFLFEQKGIESNFGTVQKHIKSVSEEKKSKTKKKKEPKTLQINSFSIENARVVFSSLDTDKTEEVQLSRIHFSTLKGTPQQIGEQILSKLTKQIIGEVAQKVVQKKIDKTIQKEIGDKLDKKLKEIFK